MSKILVAYYSFEGSTKTVAEVVAQHLNADLMEVKPVKEMQSKGFSKFIWGGSQVAMGKKPKLMPLSKNIDDYDVIFVGTPIWAGTYAPPIKTLLEGNYIKGKKVAYFYCHQGGPGKAVARARAVIERENTFVGSEDFIRPKENFEICTSKAVEWAGSVMVKIE